MEIFLFSAILILTLIFAFVFIFWITIRVTKLAINRIKNRNKNTKSERYTQNGKNYSPTGWTWNEETKLWEPPGYQKTTTNKAQQEVKAQIDYQNSYQARQIFTRNEWEGYKRLREIAQIKGYVICPKVRLLDIIEPRHGAEHYKTLFYKIQAKHVDFVICDCNMHIKAIIELDDGSHDQKDRRERDEFVNMILRSVGYKVIHTKYITYDILDTI